MIPTLSPLTGLTATAALALALSLLPAGAVAQRVYDRLWNDVEAAGAKDRPQTALRNVALVRAQALAEGNEAQLLRAMLTERVYLAQLSPDSVTAAMGRMEAMLRTKTVPADRALWHAALGRLYTFYPDATGALAEDSTRARALRHIEASLNDPAALAGVRTDAYAPLFDKEKGGKGRIDVSRTVYGDDLLHLVYRTAANALRRLAPERIAPLRSRVIACYDSLGRTDAALLLRLDEVTTATDEALAKTLAPLPPRRTAIGGRPIETTPRYRALTALAERYAACQAVVRVWEAVTDLRSTYGDDALLAAHNDSTLLADARKALTRLKGRVRKGETARLEAFIAEREAPYAALTDLPAQLMPGEKLDLTLRTRHTDRVSLRITPLARSRAAYDRAQAASGKGSTRRLDKTGLDAPRTLMLTAPEAPAWVMNRQTVAMAAPVRPGIYGVQLVLDGKAVSDEAVVSVSNVRPLVFSLDGGSRIVAVDARTGEPLAGARLTAYGTTEPQNDKGRGGGLRQVKVWTLGADATVNLPKEELRRDRSYYLTTAADAAAPSLDLGGYGYYLSADEGDTRSLVATDSTVTDDTTTADIIVPTERPKWEARPVADLFTDRAIYRPGQEVDFAAIAYRRDSTNYATLGGLEAEVKLYDTNNRAVDSLTVRTDAYGTLSGKLRLPAVTLPGTFRLQLSRGGLTGSCWIRVEEYVRPTFTVETEQPAEAAALGDTVTVRGRAKSYSGVPLEGAKVHYRIRTATWWLRGGGSEQAGPVEGETVTDSTGTFTIPVVLNKPDDDGNDRWQPREGSRYSFVVTTDVTADNGETRSATMTLHAASWRSRLELNWADRICREHPEELTIRCVNAAGTDLPATGSYRIVSDPIYKEVARGSYTAGRPFVPEAIGSLPSGNYLLITDTASEGTAADEALPADTLRFVLFSENDKRPADRLTTFFAYSRTGDDKAGALALVGTKAPHAILYYDLISASGRLIDSRRLTLSDSLARFDLRYDPAWGDGAKAFFALVSEGKLYTHTCEVRRPATDRSLRLRWETFRSTLQPGQGETWRLRVERPDGQSADAQVTAALYDASLDAIYRHDWRLSAVYDSWRLPYGRWQLASDGNGWRRDLTAQVFPRSGRTLTRTMTDWRSDLFDCYGHALGYAVTNRLYGSAVMLDAVASELSGKQEIRVRGGNKLAQPRAMSKRMAAESGSTQPEAQAPEAVRRNFAETAFFRPALQTDATGGVSLAFTLPEATTQWRFLALAHDRTMNNGRLDTLVTARKEFMVTPTLPRFVRRGDRLTIPVKVTNLTGRPLKARVSLRLDEATTAATRLLDETRTVTLAPGKSDVAFFTYAIHTDAAVIRSTARGASGSFADGEEHFITVIDDRKTVERTLPFTLDGRSSQTLRIDTLFAGSKGNGAVGRIEKRSLEVELTSHPLWTVVGALPVLAGEGSGQNALDQATRYYALTLGQSLTQRVPALRAFADSLRNGLQATDKAAGAEARLLAQIRDEAAYDQTPWLGAADRARRQAEGLTRLLDRQVAAASLHTALDKLIALQRPDGAWSWYPGMGPSTSVTLRVALLLARAQKLGEAAGADQPLLKAYDYLKKEMARQTEGMEPQPVVVPTDDQLANLYLRSLLGERPDDVARGLLDRAAKQPAALSHYEKALLIPALAEGGREEAARELLASLLEHTVATPLMGRYFDAPRDFPQGGDERLLTQCLTIEALDRFGQKTEADAMRRYLLQTKRTLGWETSAGTASAVYALLSATDSPAALGSLSDTEPVVYTLQRGKAIVGLNSRSQTQGLSTVGYSDLTYDSPEALAADRITVRKTTDGPAWGHVTATYVAPATDIVAGGQGLALQRSLAVWREGKWQTLQLTADKDSAPVLRTGERVRLTFTLTADRDYDYVCLTAARPACLAERQPLSGYRWADGLSCYRAPGVAETNYYIERLGKGTHRLTEELVVDRAGTYTSGTARLTSVFAPAFRALTGSYRLTVE